MQLTAAAVTLPAEHAAHRPAGAADAAAAEADVIRMEFHMDWNWFYSAVAQSSAAIVGIFGAFVFTKIINNQTRFNQRRETLSSLLLEARRLQDEARNRNFEWYNRLTNEDALKDMPDDLRKEKDLYTPEYYFFNSGFSQYQAIDCVLQDIAKHAEREKARRERPPHRSFVDPLRAMQFGSPTMDWSVFTRRLDRLEAERGKIDAIAVAVRAHARKIHDFLFESSQHPESSALITISVIFGLALFYVGTLLPLMRLPALINIDSVAHSDVEAAIKSLILISVAVLFTAIMLLFLCLNLTMRMKPADMEELEKFSKEPNYSEYLGYNAENLKLGSSIV
jgi:hypothetical protein